MRKQISFFHYEHRKQPLISQPDFFKRLGKSVLISGVLVFGSLGFGVLGYHFFGRLNWIDALLDATMILTSMGPVNHLQTDSGKLFACFYALFSGIVFITVVGVLFAPVLHRLLHKFHFDLESDEK